MVDFEKKKRLQLYDQFLQKFQYKKALDACFQVSQIGDQHLECNIIRVTLITHTHTHSHTHTHTHTHIHTHTCTHTASSL